MRRYWTVIGLVMLAVYGVRLYSQGMASLGSPAAARMAPSGKPVAVSLVDVAAQLGLRARFLNGGEAAKQYIIEANGTGVAFLDFDNDGRDDVFPVNGSRLKRSGKFCALRGANSIIALRCCCLNGRLEDYWENRHAA